MRVFGTSTPALEELADWLQGDGVESAVRDSKHVLRMAAVSLQRCKSAIGAMVRCWPWNRGILVAAFCIARRPATLVCRMLHWGQDYVDIEETAYEARYRKRTIANLTATAKFLGSARAPQAASDRRDPCQPFAIAGSHLVLFHISAAITWVAAHHANRLRSVLPKPGAPRKNLSGKLF